MVSCPSVAGLLIEGTFAGDPGRLELLRGIRPKHAINAITHSYQQELSTLTPFAIQKVSHGHYHGGLTAHSERSNTSTTTQCQTSLYAVRI